MQDDEFEWDDEKARINLADRGIDFMDVRPIFGDFAAIDEIDDREDYGEERILRLGWSMVASSRCAILSAATAFASYPPERQRNVSKPGTSGNAGGDGEASGKTDWTALDAMTDDEIEAAALADPDNPPWTDEQLARAKRVSFVKHLRLKLHLGRSSFASRFHIDEALIKAWERHESEPDAMAMAYLRVIAADPDSVAKTLTSATSAQAAE